MVGMREIPAAKSDDDPATGLQQIIDNPDHEIQLAQLAQYLEIGERRLTKARRYRLDLLATMKAGGATWRYLADMSGLSDTYLQREVKPMERPPDGF